LIIATWSSIILSFFTYIVMMRSDSFWRRIQCLLAIGFIHGFVGAGLFYFTTWLSAKIYRTGILLYGKKAYFKRNGKVSADEVSCGSRYVRLEGKR